MGIPTVFDLAVLLGIGLLLGSLDYFRMTPPEDLAPPGIVLSRIVAVLCLALFWYGVLVYAGVVEPVL